MTINLTYKIPGTEGRILVLNSDTHEHGSGGLGAQAMFSCRIVGIEGVRDVNPVDGMPGVYFGGFYMSPMPGCCGVVVCHHTTSSKTFMHGEYSKYLRIVKELVALHLGYRCMVATCIKTDRASYGNFKRSGYDQTVDFVNQRTDNVVAIGAKRLSPDSTKITI